MFRLVLGLLRLRMAPGHTLEQAPLNTFSDLERQNVLTVANQDTVRQSVHQLTLVTNSMLDITTQADHMITPVLIAHITADLDMTLLTVEPATVLTRLTVLVLLLLPVGNRRLQQLTSADRALHVALRPDRLPMLGSQQLTAVTQMDTVTRA